MKINSVTKKKEKLALWNKSSSRFWEEAECAQSWQGGF